MTRSQSADLAASALIISMVAEVRTSIGRQWANRFVSKEERDLLNAFVLAAEEGAGRLALRAGSRATVEQADAVERPSSSAVIAAE